MLRTSFTRKSISIKLQDKLIFMWPFMKVTSTMLEIGNLTANEIGAESTTQAHIGRGWRTAFNWTAFTNAVHFFMNDTRTAFMYIERNENANGNVKIWWTWTRTGRKKYEREKERAALFCHTEMNNIALKWNNIASKWDNNIVVVSVWVKQWSLYLFCRLRVFKNHFNFN